MPEETNPYSKELNALVDRFCSDPELRRDSATELAYIGIRIRREGGSQPVRGDIDKAAKSVLPPETVNRLYACAEQDTRLDVRSEVIFALGELGGGELVGPLLSDLNQFDPNCDLYTVVVEALGKIGGREVYEWLVPKVRNRQAPICVEQAFSGLVLTQKARDPVFAKDMEPMLGGDKDSRKRLAHQVRATLEDISKIHESIYVRWLANQTLSS